jgi:polysaccharide export outer membrane protein
MKFIRSIRPVTASGLLAVVAIITGCSGKGIPEWDMRKHGGSRTGVEGGDTNLVDAKVILQAGDPVVVTFADAGPMAIPEHRERVREDGTITLHLNVTVKAAGKTPGKLAQDIRSEYVPKYYKYLTVTVKTEERYYYVGGEVRISDRKPYTGAMTVTRAIDTAGGFTDFADKGDIVLTRANGEKFRINYKKAIKDPRYDPPVFPNDQIIVGKRWM